MMPSRSAFTSQLYLNMVKPCLLVLLVLIEAIIYKQNISLSLYVLAWILSILPYDKLTVKISHIFLQIFHICAPYDKQDMFVWWWWWGGGLTEGQTDLWLNCAKLEYSFVFYRF